MKRREFVKKGAAAGLASLFALNSFHCNWEKKKKPNVILILADDLGWMDLGCMGSTYYETPNIDRLADEGIRFTNAYANAPNCAPSRACLMSGQYTPRHGIYTVNSPERGKREDRKIIPTPNKTVLEQDVITLGDFFHSQGYATTSIGKWHLGEGVKTGPKGQGFDENIAGKHIGHPPKGYFPPYGLPNLDSFAANEYLTDRLTDEAIEFMKKNQEQPFFVYLPHYAVHTPLQAKKELIEYYQKKKNPQGDPVYAAMIHSLDEGIGKITNFLKEYHLDDNTIMIFFSDNGGVKGITDMTPLRGGKGMLYEGGIRTPLIMKWPEKIRPGRVSSELVSGIDFFPTFMEMLGMKNLDGQILDGVSLYSHICEECSLERNSLFWHFPAYLEAYHLSNEGARDSLFRCRPAGAVREGDWKLIEFFEDEDLELYHLGKDPGEQKNLIEEEPEIKERLYKKMIQWRNDLKAPVPKEKNPFYQKSEK